MRLPRGPIGGLIALLIAFCPPAAAAPGDWTVASRDAENSRAAVEERLLTPDRVGDLQVRWRVEDFRGSTSTPAVADGVVYAGAWDGTVRALDVATGAERWRTRVGLRYPGILADGWAHGGVSSSPAVVGDRVLVSTLNGAVVALDRQTGDVLWRWASDPPSFPESAIWSSPVVIDDRVVIGTGSTEVFGAKLARFRTTRGSVVALDLRSGQQLWRFRTTTADRRAGAGGTVWSSAAFDRDLGLLYIGVGQNISRPASPYSDSLLALDYRTGELRWHRQFTLFDTFALLDFPFGRDYDIGASPNLFQAMGRPAVGVADKAGKYLTFDRATGEPLWGARLTRGSHLGGVMQTAAVARGRIFVASNLVLDEGVLEDPLNTSVLFALDQQTGKVLWRRRLPGMALGAVTWAAGVAYVPTIAGAITMVAEEDGRILGRLRPSGRTLSSTASLGAGPSVAHGMVFSGYGFWFYAPNGRDRGGLTAYGISAGSG